MVNKGGIKILSKTYINTNIFTYTIRALNCKTRGKIFFNTCDGQVIYISIPDFSPVVPEHGFNRDIIIG